MRNQTILFALLAFSIATTGYSQVKTTITVGKPYPVVDADVKVYFRKGNDIITVKQEKKVVTLQKFNATTLTFQKVKVYDDFPKNFVMERVMQVKHAYYYFYSCWDGDNEQLFAREIDFEAGQFKGAGKKILSNANKMSGSLGKTSFFGVGVFDKYSFFFSYDSSKMLVQYRMKPEKKRDNKNYDVIGMHVFNAADLTQQWSGQVTMPYTEKKMDILDYSIDSKGNNYVIAKVFKDNSTDDKKRGEDEANYALELLKVSAPNGQVTSTRVDVAGKFIHTLWMYEDSGKENMLCTGFYNSGKEAASADGIVLFKLKPDGTYSDLSTYPIPLDVINLNAGKKAIRKNEKKEDKDRAELGDIRFREALIQPDGSVVLVSEEQYTIVHHTYSPQGGSSSYTSFHYDNILVSKIGADGQLVWMKKLPKRQRGSVGRGGMSYVYIQGDNGVHHFICLDNEKNKALNTIDIPEQHTDGKGGFMVDFSINDATGEVTKTYMADLRDIKGIEVYQFATSRVMPYGNDTFIFEAYKKGKEDVLVKIQVRK